VSRFELRRLGVSKLILPGLIAACFSACSFNLSSPTEPRQYFVLEELGSPKSDVRAPLGSSGADKGIIRVRETSSGRFIDSQRIIFSSGTGVRGYYQFAFWVEPPPEMFSRILENALSQAAMFSTIVKDSSGIAADYELSTVVLDFYHDTSERPGSVFVKVEAEMIDLDDRRVLGRKVFSSKIDADSYDVNGAVDAFQKAVGAVVPEILHWIEASGSNQL